MTLAKNERAALERRLGFDHYYEMERGDSKGNDILGSSAVSPVFELFSEFRPVFRQGS